MRGKITSKANLNKSRPLSANRKRKGESMSMTRERGTEKERAKKQKEKKIRIFFVCGEFDNNSKWCFFIYLFLGQHFNCQIIHTR